MELTLFILTGSKKLVLIIALITITLSGLNAGIIAKVPPVIKSIILPGWGEVSQGYNRGYAKIIADVALWTGFFYYSEESDLLTDKAFNYAVRFAGIPNMAHDTQYLTDIGKYNHSGFDARGYNAMVVATANARYQTDSVARQDYIDENMYQDDMAWQWSATDRRSKYTTYRKKSLDYDDYASLAAGLLIVNRLASCIDLLIIRQHNLKTSVSMYDYQTPMLNISIAY